MRVLLFFFIIILTALSSDAFAQDRKFSKDGDPLWCKKTCEEQCREFICPTYQGQYVQTCWMQCPGNCRLRRIETKRCRGVRD